MFDQKLRFTESLNDVHYTDNENHINVRLRTILIISALLFYRLNSYIYIIQVSFVYIYKIKSYTQILKLLSNINNLQTMMSF